MLQEKTMFGEHDATLDNVFSRGSKLPQIHFSPMK